MKLLQDIFHQPWRVNVLLLSSWIAIFWLLDASPWTLVVIVILFLWLSQLSLSWTTPNQWDLHSSTSKYLTHSFSASLPILLFWLLYHIVLQGWWTVDDPCLLELADLAGPIPAFFDPTIHLGSPFFAPFQNFSLGIDYKLFALNPQGFYWHHLLSFSLVLLFAYILLSQFFTPLLSSMIVSLFVVCVPTVETAYYLMVRHYVEGLGFSLIAIWAYMRALNRNRWAWLVLGSGFYFLATLSKEIYVPLVILLPFLPVATIKARFRSLVPYLFVLAIYILLRTSLLGLESLIASQPYDQGKTTWLHILHFPNTFRRIMGWGALWQQLPILGILAVFLVALWKNPLQLGSNALLWAAIAFAPIMPILFRVSFFHYYLLLPGLLFALACGISLEYIGTFLPHSSTRRLATMACFLVILLANLLPNQERQGFLQKAAEDQKIQGEFLLHAPMPAATFIYRYHCATSLIYLRDRVLDNPSGINWCRENDCVCQALYSGQTAWRYEREEGLWYQERLPQREFEECGNSSELSVALQLDSANTLEWHLGPYSQGTYFLLTAFDADNPLKVAQLSWRTERFMMIPQVGEHVYPRTIAPPLKVVVKYAAPEGWETYSPLLELGPAQETPPGLTELAWRRPVTNSE